MCQSGHYLLSTHSHVSNYKPALKNIRRNYDDKNLISTNAKAKEMKASKSYKSFFFNFIETKISCIESTSGSYNPNVSYPYLQKLESSCHWSRCFISNNLQTVAKTLRNQIVQLVSNLTVPTVVGVVSQNITTSKQMKYRDKTDESGKSDNEIKSYDWVPNTNSRSTYPFLEPNSNHNS